MVLATPHTHIHQADTLHAQAELQKKLADLTKADISKFYAHIKTEDQERERIQRHFGSSTKRTHMAAAEYQASKDTPNPVSRQVLADKYETTVSMMRTAEELQKHPFDVRKHGPDSTLSDDDYDLIGNVVLDKALQDRTMTMEDLRSLMLRVANENLRKFGKQTMVRMSNSTWKRSRAKLVKFWEKRGVPLITRKKTAKKQATRKKAEMYAIPTFIDNMKRLHERYPDEAKCAANYGNLDEQGLCEKESRGKTATTMQAPTVTGDDCSAVAKEPPPPPVTLVTITFGDGEKGPPVIMRKGSTPYLKKWFTQLPPGLTMADIDETEWVYGDTDRMHTPKLLEILEKVMYKRHVAKVGEGQQLFWFIDAPSCHGVSQDYELSVEMRLLCKRLGICLIVLPRDSTHRLQANDFYVHLLSKAGIRDLESAARLCWTNKNCFIIKDRLAEGVIQVETCLDGIGDDGSERDASLKSPQFRAAHLHVGTQGDAFNWNQRNVIIAALWTWKFRVTADCIIRSYAATGLLPFDPEAHKKYTEKEHRVPDKMRGVVAATQTYRRVRLEEASPVFICRTCLSLHLCL